jgi:hypothetical protein
VFSPASCRAWLAALLIGLHTSMPSALAQAPEAGVKAAFTLNFAKFAHWPDGATDPQDAQLRVCVAGHSPVGASLQSSEGERVGGRRLAVDVVRLPGNVTGCHLLYVSDLDLARERRVLASLSRLPILTVSDIPGFAAAGGMIELVILDRRLRFEINLEVVRRAGMRLDPDLLRLATRVHGEAKSGD